MPKLDKINWQAIFRPIHGQKWEQDDYIEGSFRNGKGELQSRWVDEVCSAMENCDANSNKHVARLGLKPLAPIPMSRALSLIDIAPMTHLRSL